MVKLAGVEYHIVIGGVDVSSRFNPYLLRLSVSDRDGAASASATIELDDQDGAVALPRAGTRIIIGLGRAPDLFEGVIDSVRWVVDRGGGSRLAVTARGMDPRGAIVAPVERHFDDMTLGEVMQSVAELGGLSGVSVHPSLGSIRRPYWVLDTESPLAFGRRIAREVGATFKVVGASQGVFTPRNAGLSASGKSLTAINAIYGDNLIAADIAPFTGRPQSSSVMARWYDLDAARYRTKRVDLAQEDGGAHLLAAPRPDESEASEGAASEGQERRRAKGGGSIVINGDPTAQPGAICNLTARAGVSGAYIIDGVTNTLDRGQGGVTNLEVVRPQ